MRNERLAQRPLPYDPYLEHEETVPGVIPERPATLLEIPFSPAELRKIGAASRQDGIRIYEYIRRAALEKAEQATE